MEKRGIEEIGSIVRDRTIFQFGNFRIIMRKISLRHGETLTRIIWDRGEEQFVVVFALTDDGKIVLTRESKYGIWERIVSLSGGGVEKGESLEETAKRELLEETGYDSSDIRLMRGPVYGFADKIQGGAHWFFLALHAKSAQKPEIYNDVVLVDSKEISLLIEGKHPEVEIKTAMTGFCLACAKEHLKRLESQPV